jgi:hypothetical protein
MTTADARETARAWLAERIGEKQWIRTSIDGMTSITAATAEDLADAILSADGVEVAEQRILRFVPTGALVDHGSIAGPDPEQAIQRFTQVVIRLPAQPISGKDF